MTPDLRTRRPISPRTSPRRRLGLAAAAILLAGCGAAPAEPRSAASASQVAAPAEAATPASDAAPAQDDAQPPASETAEKPTMPTGCAKRTDGLCTPPRAFVQRLCSGAHPDVALTMFGKATPWTRAYVARDVEAWNASGGAAPRGSLAYEEEVLLLAHRGGGGGAVQVSGSESYDVLRWDGTCASLMSDEITMKRPAKAKHALIPWRRLDASVRDALVAERHIGKLDSERRKECKGATFGAVTPACSRVDERLSILVVEYIRGGGPVPPPENVP